MVECPRCGGAGEVQHPRWGSRSCPTPEIVCPFCGGKGEVSQDALDDWNDELDRAERRRIEHESQPDPYDHRHNPAPFCAKCSGPCQIPEEPF